MQQAKSHKALLNATRVIATVMIMMITSIALTACETNEQESLTQEDIMEKNAAAIQEAIGMRESLSQQIAQDLDYINGGLIVDVRVENDDIGPMLYLTNEQKKVYFVSLTYEGSYSGIQENDMNGKYLFRLVY